MITSLILFALVATNLSAQTVEEANMEVVEKYLKAYVDADLNTLATVMDKAFIHYLWDIPRENYDEFMNLIKKKRGTVQLITHHEMVAVGDKVFVRWTAELPPDIYNGINWFTLKDGKVLIDREYYKLIN